MKKMLSIFTVAVLALCINAECHFCVYIRIYQNGLRNRTACVKIYYI